MTASVNNLTVISEVLHSIVKAIVTTSKPEQTGEKLKFIDHIVPNDS